MTRRLRRPSHPWRAPLWLALAALPAAAGCGATGGRSAGVPAADLPVAQVRHALSPGTVIRLLPSTATGPAEPDRAFVDPLWREALRQSPRFDIAAGTEDTASPFEIDLHDDRPSKQMTSTLRQPGQPPIPLASAAGEVPGVIDRLALATRQALGESIDTWPEPAAAIYSDDRQCVDLTERAMESISEGEWSQAVTLLRQARSRDPGCTYTLAALARTLMALGTVRAHRGTITEAQRTSVEGLSLSSRLSPTTKHRLLYVAVVTGADETGGPAASDRELLVLGDVALGERPYDPYALHSRAIALNFLARYDESAPLLRQLAARWPRSAEVAYHLTFAELAQGHPEAALEAIRRAESRLPRQYLVVPTALALFHCGRHDEVDRYLADLAADPVYAQTAGLHELRRMQAAHSLLTDRREDAVRFMLLDLEWIRQRRSQLDGYVLDVAETGEVLVRMGHHRELRLPLEAFEQLGDLPPVFAQAMVFLGGLVQVAEENRRAEAAEAHLRSNGQTVWSSIVAAAAHRRSGELLDELRERLYEYERTESPLVRASLARVLVAAGDPEDAAGTLAELRRRLLAFNLRRQNDHPLMRPSTALAYLAIEQLSPK